MNQISQLLHRGGFAVALILGISVALYACCLDLVVASRVRRREIEQLRVAGRRDVIRLRRMQSSLRHAYRSRRTMLLAMIAAAPLLGLLGTVNGMMTTFEGLASAREGGAMQELARGISEVLLATQAGLTVALPALLFVYYGYRQLVAQLSQLKALEVRAAERT